MGSKKTWMVTNKKSKNHFTSLRSQLFKESKEAGTMCNVGFGESSSAYKVFPRDSLDFHIFL